MPHLLGTPCPSKVGLKQRNCSTKVPDSITPYKVHPSHFTLPFNKITTGISAVFPLVFTSCRDFTIRQNDCWRAPIAPYGCPLPHSSALPTSLQPIFSSPWNVAFLLAISDLSPASPVTSFYRLNCPPPSGNLGVSMELLVNNFGSSLVASDQWSVVSDQWPSYWTHALFSTCYPDVLWYRLLIGFTYTQRILFSDHVR